VTCCEYCNNSSSTLNCEKFPEFDPVLAPRELLLLNGVTWRSRLLSAAYEGCLSKACCSCCMRAENFSATTALFVLRLEIYKFLNL